MRAITPMGAGDKVDGALVAGGAHAVSVQTVTGAAGAGARRLARGAGRRLAAPLMVDELSTQFLRLDGSDVAALAADPGVVAITAWSAPQLRDERSAQIVAGNLTGAGAPDPDPSLDYPVWLEDQGFGNSTFDFAIDVTDSGLDNGADPPAHPDFYEDGVKPGDDRVQYIQDYTQDTGANLRRDCAGHGTNVASIAAGYGGSTPGDGQGFKYGTGVAPRALIGASKVFDCSFKFSSSATYRDIAAAAYASPRKARISNNSWGVPRLSVYGPEAQIYDSIVRDASPETGNQEMVEVFAAGNDGIDFGYGSIDSPGTAKNVITVGASEGVRAAPGGIDGCDLSDTQADHAGDVLGLSSRGPTVDGRLKPDLVAPGSHIAGAAPQHGGYSGSFVCNELFPAGNPFHSLSSGTSQATPHVSGAAALIREWFGRPEVGGAPPSPAMTKAILTNAASDLAGRTNGKGDLIARGPNNDQGWGRVNVGAALDSTTREYRDQLDLIGQTGGARPAPTRSTIRPSRWR